MFLIDFIRSLGISTEGWVLIVVALMSIIQVVPIQINPWSRIGAVFSRDLLKKMESLEKRIQEVEDGVKMANDKCDKYEERRDADRAVLTRIRILRFNDELLRMHKHSHETFSQVLDDITYYENFCQEHEDFPNARAVEAINNIRRNYAKRCEQHDFLGLKEEIENEH